MAIVTATQVTQYSDISASAATIASSGLIPMIQAKINAICNNYFTTDIYTQGACTFSGTTITCIGANLAGCGFAEGDEVYIYNSYRNDSYKTIGAVSGSAMTVGEAVVSELSGASIMISLVQWPLLAQQAAAQMIKYDYDDRPNRTAGIKAHSLGPFSESFGTNEVDAQWGYPTELMDMLRPFMRARLL